jgi:hypothetical protein
VLQYTRRHDIWILENIKQTTTNGYYPITEQQLALGRHFRLPKISICPLVSQFVLLSCKEKSRRRPMKTSKEKEEEENNNRNNRQGLLGWLNPFGYGWERVSYWLQRLTGLFLFIL